jgi:predicted porin
LEKIEMKKTLVAIAALAAIGAASAQSSVTLYGRIDASIGGTKTTTGGATTADPGVSISSGALTGSRWGLRGSEDLGGGLKANFTLEQGFAIDTGAEATATLVFSRQAFVGLSGGFGTLNIGRQYDIVDNMYGIYDAMGSGGFTANNALSGAGNVGDYIVRQNNAVMYTTPNMGGLTATAMWAPGENKVVGVGAVGAGKNVGAMINYANGPLGIGAGWQSNKATSATAATTHYIIGASYDLGVAKLFGQYDAGKVKSLAGSPKDDGFSLGAVIPVGAAQLQVTYATEDMKTAGVKTAENSAFGLLGRYDLSKRTYVYAGYRRQEADPVVGATVKTTKYGLGLVHNF